MGEISLRFSIVIHKIVHQNRLFQTGGIFVLPARTKAKINTDFQTPAVISKCKFQKGSKFAKFVKIFPVLERQRRETGFLQRDDFAR